MITEGQRLALNVVGQKAYQLREARRALRNAEADLRFYRGEAARAGASPELLAEAEAKWPYIKERPSWFPSEASPVPTEEEEKG